MSVRTEILRVSEESEVRIPHIHHRARNFSDSGDHNRALHHPRDAHLAFDEVDGISRVNDMAGTKAAVSAKRDVQLSIAACKPCGDAACAVAGELCLASIGVE